MYTPYHRREQQAPAIGVRGKISRSLAPAAKILESPTPPAFPVGTLRDYQWEGCRWLLFNWSQKRNRYAPTTYTHTIRYTNYTTFVIYIYMQYPGGRDGKRV